MATHEDLRSRSGTILVEEFGDLATVRLESEFDQDLGRPRPILYLGVPLACRTRRSRFLDRYVREIGLPEGPVPVLVWEYEGQLLPEKPRS